MYRTYTESEKRECVRAWILYGSYKEVERVTGVPWETVAGWKHREPEWWEKTRFELAVQAIENMAEPTQIKAAKARDKALEVIMARLEHGEQKFNVKTGEMVSVPASLADATKAFAALGGEKVKLQPKEEVPEEDRIAALAKLAEEDRASRPN
jgi:hypothetical protein